MKNHENTGGSNRPSSLNSQQPRNEPPPDTTLEHAKIIREMLRHEDDVIDQRFTWLCQIQGFLFAALAFAWRDSSADQLVSLLSFLGILVAITTWSSLKAVSCGVYDLLRWWDTNKPDGYSGPDVYSRRKYQPGQKQTRRFVRPWHILPLIFGLAWVMVLIIRFWPTISPHLFACQILVY